MNLNFRKQFFFRMCYFSWYVEDSVKGPDYVNDKG